MHMCSIYVFVYCFGAIVISGQVIGSLRSSSNDASHRLMAFASNKPSSLTWHHVTHTERERERERDLYIVHVS